MIARAEAFGKEGEKHGGNRESLTSIVALYQEANPHVHGGMFSIAQVLEGGTKPQPRMRLLTAGRLLSVLAGHALLDMLEASRATLGIDTLNDEIVRIGNENLAVVDELKRP